MFNFFFFCLKSAIIGIVCYNNYPLYTQNHEVYLNKSYDKSIMKYIWISHMMNKSYDEVL